MEPNRPEVVVVGAGVIGLCAAIRLAERHHRVRVYAERRGEGTASYAAGAIFDPFMAEHEQLDAWAEATLGELEERHAEGHPWVRILDGVEAARHTPAIPDSARRRHGFRECDRRELPEGFVTGWRYRAPLIEMPAYLDYLERRLKSAGGEIEERRLAALPDADIVVNCAGIGARNLVPGEKSLRPVSGQLVMIRNPGIEQFFVEHTPGLDVGESTYLLPHGDVLLLGGNATEGELSGAPDPAVEAGILQRCADVFPATAGAEVLGRRFGVRPYRSRVRLQLQRRGHRSIVHNYGHGGSGVSLAWGCADAVAEIVSGLTA